MFSHNFSLFYSPCSTWAPLFRIHCRILLRRPVFTTPVVNVVLILFAASTILSFNCSTDETGFGSLYTRLFMHPHTWIVLVVLIVLFFVVNSWSSHVCIWSQNRASFSKSSIDSVKNGHIRHSATGVASYVFVASLRRHTITVSVTKKHISIFLRRVGRHLQHFRITGTNQSPVNKHSCHKSEEIVQNHSQVEKLSKTISHLPCTKHISRLTTKTIPRTLVVFP